ncbi:ankyrin repeat-containing protein, partial [Chrysochromulina tobinii]
MGKAVGLCSPLLWARAGSREHMGWFGPSKAEKLWNAASDGDEAEFGRLIERGGNVNWHNPGHGEFTALIISSVYGREGCVRLLLDSKAAVNATDVDGWTALHWAAYEGHLAVTKLLLEGGADPTLRNKAGNTALDCDRSWGRSEVVALLSEPRYAARMHTDCPAMPSGCAEAPSWAHADHGFSAARQTNGGQSPWDEAERTQRSPHGATQRLAIAHPQDFRTESARATPTRRGGHVGCRRRTRGLVC